MFRVLIRLAPIIFSMRERVILSIVVVLPVVVSVSMLMLTLGAKLTIINFQFTFDVYLLLFQI